MNGQVGCCKHSKVCRRLTLYTCSMDGGERRDRYSLTLLCCGSIYHTEPYSAVALSPRLSKALYCSISTLLCKALPFSAMALSYSPLLSHGCHTLPYSAMTLSYSPLLCHGCHTLSYSAMALSFSTMLIIREGNRSS